MFVKHVIREPIYDHVFIYQQLMLWDHLQNAGSAHKYHNSNGESIKTLSILVYLRKLVTYTLQIFLFLYRIIFRNVFS